MVGAVAGYGEVGGFFVFEADVEAASGEGGDFANPCEVDDGGAMDAGELFRVEFPFQFRDGVVDAVWLALGDGPGELVFGVEVGDLVEVDEPEAIAEARGDTVGVLGFRVAEDCRSGWAELWPEVRSRSTLLRARSRASGSMGLRR